METAKKVVTNHHANLPCLLSSCFPCQIFRIGSNCHHHRRYSSDYYCTSCPSSPAANGLLGLANHSTHDHKLHPLLLTSNSSPRYYYPRSSSSLNRPNSTLNPSLNRPNSSLNHSNSSLSRNYGDLALPLHDAKMTTAYHILEDCRHNILSGSTKVANWKSMQEVYCAHTKEAIHKLAACCTLEVYRCTTAHCYQFQVLDRPSCRFHRHCLHH